MKVHILMFMVLGAEFFNFAEAYSKCDPKIVKKIKKYWNGNTPKNLIEQAKANCKEFVIATTAGYYPEGLKCVYSVFENDGFTMFQVPKKGKPQSKCFTITEDDGKTVSITGDEIIVRYHVYQKKGVTGIYTCNEKGEDSDLFPDGFIKVADGKVDDAALHEAHEVLGDIGVELKETYCKQHLGGLVLHKSGSDSSSSESDESKSSKSSED